MESAEAIRERSADGGITSIGANHPFLYGSIASCPRQDRWFERFPSLRFFGYGRHHFHQQRMNHEAVVVIPMELRPITVNAVAFVPLIVLPDRIIDTHGVPGLARKTEKCF